MHDAIRGRYRAPCRFQETITIALHSIASCLVTIADLRQFQTSSRRIAKQSALRLGL